MDKTSRTVVELADDSPDIIRLVNRLAGQDWNVHLVCHKAPPKEALDRRVQVHKLPITAAYPMTYAAFLVAAPMILRIKPDIIHAHYLTTYGILAAVHRRFLRFKPMVITACGDDILADARKGVTRWSAEHALKMFESITCDGDQVARGLHDLEAPGDKIEQVNLSAGSDETFNEAVDRLEAIYLKLIQNQAKRQS